MSEFSEISACDDTWLYLITEDTVINRATVIGANGAGVKGTAAVAVCGLNGLGRRGRSKGCHADDDNKSCLDRELHLGALMEQNESAWLGVQEVLFANADGERDFEGDKRVLV